MALFAARLAAGAGFSTGRAQYAVATDGRFLVNSRLDDAPPPISVVLNWAAGLNK